MSIPYDSLILNMGRKTIIPEIFLDIKFKAFNKIVNGYLVSDLSLLLDNINS